MKILWVSQHSPLPRQLEDLKSKFGNVTVEQEARPFDSAEHIARRYKEGGYHEMVVVAPLSVISRLIDLGIQPLWAEMEAVDARVAEVHVKNRHYRFIRFRRIVAIEFRFEEL